MEVALSLPQIDLDHKDPQGLVIDLNDHHLDALPLDQGRLATVESYAEEGKRGRLERNDKFNITYSGRTIFKREVYMENQ